MQEFTSPQPAQPSVSLSSVDYDAQDSLVVFDGTVQVAWELLQGTYFATKIPTAAQQMDAALEAKTTVPTRTTDLVPDEVSEVADSFKSLVFTRSVYPAIQKSGLKPGMCRPVASATGETLYCIITPSALVFYDRLGMVKSLDPQDPNLSDISLESVDTGAFPGLVKALSAYDDAITDGGLASYVHSYGAQGK